MTPAAVDQSVLDASLRFARRVGLTRALYRLSARVSPRAQLWLRDRGMDARMLAGDYDGLLASLGTYVDEDAYGRALHDAFARLAEGDREADVGDYLEFGVFKGTSLACAHQVLSQRGLEHVRLFGFDSFEGLPANTRSDDTWEIARWDAGYYKAPYELCRRNLTERGVDWRRTTLVKGFFEDTLTPDLARQHGIRKAGVIMVDCDLYSSARTALEFCAPLILDRAVILFDDWWDETLGAARAGERRAFEELLASEPDLRAEEVDSYAPGSARVFFVTRTGSDGSGASRR